jgi:hypothetical protein
MSKRACNQIKRKTTPNYCTYSNEFSLQVLRLTLDAKRVGDCKLTGCKLTRLQRGLVVVGQFVKSRKRHRAIDQFKPRRDQ